MSYTDLSPAYPPNTYPLSRESSQLAGLFTIIRDLKTSRADYIFYSDRIIRLLIEEGAFLTWRVSLSLNYLL